MQKTCRVCGKPFIALNPHEKYCSEACQKEGRRRTRKAWEGRTGYLEKKRIQERQRRERLAEELQRENIARGKQRSEDFDRELEERQARELAELRKAAAAGDPEARMLLASSGGKIDWPSYWAAYRDYEIEYTKNSGLPEERIVNNIPVSDPDFVEKVIAAIETQGVIMTALISSSEAAKLRK